MSPVVHCRLAESPGIDHSRGDSLETRRNNVADLIGEDNRPQRVAALRLQRATAAGPVA
jgi:hypothetical protein